MGIHEYVEIKSSGIHRHGVFAKKDIPKDMMIIEYTGRIISKDESDRILSKTISRHKKDLANNAATYIFDISLEEDLDGDIPENDARFINHSCDPNCKYEIIGKRVFIRSIRDIRKGEEITYNYGFVLDETDPESFKDHPCRCGSSRCAGYILSEEDWPKIRKLIEKEHNP